MWDNIKFWLAREIAQFIWGIGFIAILIGGCVLYIVITDWKSKRKRK